MAKLVVDLDVLQMTINTYNTEIIQFEGAKASINRSLIALKTSGWDSQASKTWFSLLDDEWLKNIDYQIRVLKRLRDNMIIAKNEYQDIREEQERLDDCL